MTPEIPTLEQVIAVIDTYVTAEDKLHRLYRYHHDVIKMILKHPDHRDDLVALRDTLASMIQTYNLVFVEERRQHGRPETRQEFGRPRKVVTEEQVARDAQSYEDAMVELARAGRFEDLPMWLSPKVVARIFEITEGTLYDWGYDGVIEYEKDPGGRRNRYHRDEVRRVYTEGGKGKKHPVVFDGQASTAPARTGMWARKGRNMEDPSELTATELRRRREEALSKSASRKRRKP